MTASKPSDSAPYLTGLVRTLRDCCQRKEAAMCKQLRLTSSQFAFLVALPSQDAEWTVQDAAKALALSHSRSSRLVDTLVRKGLLHRESMPGDRRKQRLVLTPSGQRMWQAIHKLFQECEQKLRAAMPARVARDLESTLQSFIRAW